MTDAGWTARQEYRRQFSQTDWYRRLVPMAAPALLAIGIMFLAITALI